MIFFCYRRFLITLKRYTRRHKMIKRIHTKETKDHVQDLSMCIDCLHLYVNKKKLIAYISMQYIVYITSCNIYVLITNLSAIKLIPKLSLYTKFPLFHYQQQSEDYGTLIIMKLYTCVYVMLCYMLLCIPVFSNNINIIKIIRRCAYVPFEEILCVIFFFFFFVHWC